VLGVRNTLDKLRKHLLYFGSVKNHGNPASRNVMYFIILMRGDIELNPGPNSIYPCGYCEIPVTWEQQRLLRLLRYMVFLNMLRIKSNSYNAVTSQFAMNMNVTMIVMDLAGRE
jgi:hypothetical protein